MPLPLPLRLMPLLATSLASAGPDFGRAPAGGVGPAGATPRSSGPVMRVGQEADGLFRLTLPVNGAAVRFVVDTGANVVVLTPADAVRIRARPVAGGARRLRTAAGDAAMIETRIDGLTIAGRRIGPVRAVIAPGAPSSLLGQSALGQLESVTLRGDRLELR